MPPAAFVVRPLLPVAPAPCSPLLMINPGAPKILKSSWQIGGDCLHRFARCCPLRPIDSQSIVMIRLHHHRILRHERLAARTHNPPPLSRTPRAAKHASGSRSCYNAWTLPPPHAISSKNTRTCSHSSTAEWPYLCTQGLLTAQKASRDLRQTGA